MGIAGISKQRAGCEVGLLAVGDAADARDGNLLEIEIEASQQTGTDVSFVTTGGEEISTPTLGIRRSNTLVYLKPGQAVILGGLITERSVEDEKKVPLLGDIPVMGHLFKSKYQRKELVSVLFFIRPRVLEGIDLHRDF